MDQETTDVQSGIFKAPLTKDDLHRHIVTVSLLLARQLHFVFGRSDSNAHQSAQATLLGIDSTEGMNNPEVYPGMAGGVLSYAHLATTTLATTMEALYNFAYHGVHLERGFDMNGESSASWVSRILLDLTQSRFADEWHEYSPCQDALKLLLSTCETAEARMILENIQADDTFMGWYGYEGQEGLTFRHMALLSGMSEASLRTLANPKRNNHLKTHSNGRNTYIEREDARAWLISKGRYVPLIETDFAGAKLDLSSEVISTLDELQVRLNSRLYFLLSSEDFQSVTNELKSIRSDLLARRTFDETPYLNLSTEDLTNSPVLKKIARALQLQEDLFELKVAHLLAIQKAQETQRRFDDAAHIAQKNRQK
jgi:hypothetical protein